MGVAGWRFALLNKTRLPTSRTHWQRNAARHTTEMEFFVCAHHAMPFFYRFFTTFCRFFTTPWISPNARLRPPILAQRAKAGNTMPSSDPADTLLDHAHCRAICDEIGDRLR